MHLHGVVCLRRIRDADVECDVKRYTEGQTDTLCRIVFLAQHVQQGCQYAGGQPDNAYMWQEFEPPVGACPCLVRSVGDTFVGNQASVAGGAVYATDMASLQMSCSFGLPSNNVTGCSSPAWDDNAVQALVQSPNAEQGGPHG